MASTSGKITDEGIENLRGRLGSYYRGGQSLRVLSKDILSRFALDHGVRNPLFFDNEYGKKTRYGSMIGFPNILGMIKTVSGTPVGGLPGVQAYQIGGEWDFYHVVRPGDEIGATYRPARVDEKTGQYAGRMVFVYGEDIYMNQRGEVVGRCIAPSARTDRAAAQKRGKYTKDTEKTKYTEEQLHEIWDSQNRVEVRGATPRYWEDVQVGDELPILVKGPLRRVDVAFSRPGPGEQMGAGAWVRGAHWYVLESFLKHPGYAAGGVEGAGEHPHAGHWEKEMAQALGIPGAYDLAPQRGGWLMQLVLNWIGDDAFLRKFYYETRRFNLEGDTTFIRGKVTDKWIEGRQHVAKFELSAQDQRGKNTTWGYAEAVLPSRYPGFEVPM